MKLLTFLIHIIVFLIQSQFSYTQDYYQITFRYNILNHVPGNLPKELKNNWQTSSNTFELILDKTLTINDHFNLNAGLGFSVFRFSNSNLFSLDNIRQSNYAIIKYGLSKRIYLDNLFLNLDILHYVLARKEKQDDNQRRAFTNAEVGLSYNINERFKISFSSPFTLYSMFLLRIGTGNIANNEPITRYNSKVRNYGLNFGFTYTFKNNRIN